MPWAEEVLASEDYLSDHLDLIEAYMDCVDQVRRKGLRTERFIAICGLHLRTFDAFGHCLRAAVSGNYSGCAMYARDLLETAFLIDYLLDEPGRPETWLRSDPDTAYKSYKPAAIREALDRRDGFKTMKRRDHYRMLSALGAHPTPSAFNLKRDATQTINFGPFKQADMVKECVQEAAKLAVVLGGRLQHYCILEFPDGELLSSRLSIVLQRMEEKYFSRGQKEG